MDKLLQTKIDIFKILLKVESPIKLTLEQIYILGEIYILGMFILYLEDELYSWLKESKFGILNIYIALLGFLGVILSSPYLLEIVHKIGVNIEPWIAWSLLFEIIGLLGLIYSRLVQTLLAIVFFTFFYSIFIFIGTALGGDIGVLIGVFIATFILYRMELFPFPTPIKFVCRILCFVCDFIRMSIAIIRKKELTKKYLLCP